MVTRLRFKGDKPRKRKKGLDKGEITKRARISNATATEPTPEPFNRELVEQGWTTATVTGDVTGPVVLGRYDEDEKSQPYVLSVAEGAVGFSSSLDVLPHHECVNFPPDGDAAPYLHPIHLMEPTVTSQVLMVTQIRSLDTGKRNQQSGTNDVRVTLRSAEGKYLSFGKSGLTASAEAVGEGEIFTFTKRFKKGLGVWWSILVKGHKVVTLPGEGGAHRLQCIPDTEDLIDDENHYVVRVQTKNSVRGKQILAEIENNETHGDRILEAVKAALAGLAKENVPVTTDLMKQLMAAAEAGRLNETVVELKTKGKHDSRC